MATLRMIKHELFAQALARGKTQEAAYKEAGFKPKKSARGSASKLAGRPEVNARTRELLARTAPGEPLDKLLLIDDLMRLARKGEELGTAAGLAASGHCIVKALGVAATLPPPPEEPMPGDEDLTMEEWMTRYGVTEA